MRAARAWGGDRAARARTLAALLLAPACAAPAVEGRATPEAEAEAGRPPSSELAAEALAEVERYYASLSARDWEAFADHFWPEATLTTTWKPAGEEAPRVFTTTVPEFVARAPEGPDSQPIFEEELVSAEVRAAGDVAQVWAHYRATFGTPDALQTWTGIDAITLMRHEGRWRITSIAFAALR